MILATPLEQAWAALSSLTPGRGTVGAYSGLARLVEADDDTHTATLRLHGTGPSGPVTATVTAALEAAEGGTRLHVSTRANPAPDAATIHALTERLAAALVPVTPEPERGRPRGRLVSAALHRMGRR